MRPSRRSQTASSGKLRGAAGILAGLIGLFFLHVLYVPVQAFSWRLAGQVMLHVIAPSNGWADGLGSFALFGSDGKLSSYGVACVLAGFVAFYSLVDLAKQLLASGLVAPLLTKCVLRLLMCSVLSGAGVFAGIPGRWLGPVCVPLFAAGGAFLGLGLVDLLERVWRIAPHGHHSNRGRILDN